MNRPLRWLLLGLLLWAPLGCERPPHSPLSRIDRDVDRTPWQGEVVEILPAGGYTYLRVVPVEVTPPTGEGGAARWVVGLERAGVGLGGQVEVRPLGRATDFESRRLGRRFPVLWFALIHPQTLSHTPGHSGGEAAPDRLAPGDGGASLTGSPRPR